MHMGSPLHLGKVICQFKKGEKRGIHLSVSVADTSGHIKMSMQMNDNDNKTKKKLSMNWSFRLLCAVETMKSSSIEFIEHITVKG